MSDEKKKKEDLSGDTGHLKGLPHEIYRPVFGLYGCI
jgi:hypothetical protein